LAFVSYFTLVFYFLLFFSPVLPQIIPFSFGDEEVNFDDAVTAACTITKGDQPIKIWWTLQEAGMPDSYNLSTNDGIVITRNSQKVSILTIEAVKARHRGNYTCHAQNKGGVAQHSAFLSVNGSNIFHWMLVFSHWMLTFF